MKVREVRALYNTQAKEKVNNTAAAKCKRMVRWSEQGYELLYDSGARFASLNDIEEGAFCIYRRNDYAVMTRNKSCPVYEAVYILTNGTKVLAQKGQLKRAYTAAGHTNHHRAWSLAENGVCYWVDRYLVSVLKL